MVFIKTDAKIGKKTVERSFNQFLQSKSKVLFFICNFAAKFI